MLTLSRPLQLAYCPSTTSSFLFIDQEATSLPQDSLSLSLDSFSTINAAAVAEENGDEAVPEPDTPIRELIKELYDAAAVMSDERSEVEDVDAQTVVVKLKPDSEGKFGFNIKGGFDQNCPVLVSKVAKNSPADNNFPTKLHEGDQVLSINDVQVAQLTHEQVIALIRNNTHPDSELVLKVRPNGKSFNILGKSTP